MCGFSLSLRACVRACMRVFRSYIYSDRFVFYGCLPTALSSYHTNQIADWEVNHDSPRKPFSRLPWPKLALVRQTPRGQSHATTSKPSTEEHKQLRPKRFCVCFLRGASCVTVVFNLPKIEAISTRQLSLLVINRMSKFDLLPNFTLFFFSSLEHNAEDRQIQSKSIFLNQTRLVECCPRCWIHLADWCGEGPHND